MAKTWTSDHPKARLMDRKRAQIVEAAQAVFLAGGFAASSVNKIAEDAGVSIKTLYRHFETKDDLFSAVMAAACRPPDDGATEPSWYSAAPEFAFATAGEEYLRHALSDDQLAIYRVVACDAHRFPEVGHRYRREVLGHSAALFAGYLDRWEPVLGWKITDKYRAATVFGTLLRAGLFDDALLGGTAPTPPMIAAQASEAAKQMIALVEAGLL